MPANLTRALDRIDAEAEAAESDWRDEFYDGQWYVWHQLHPRPQAFSRSDAAHIANASPDAVRALVAVARFVDDCLKSHAIMPTTGTGDAAEELPHALAAVIGAAE